MSGNLTKNTKRLDLLAGAGIVLAALLLYLATLAPTVLAADAGEFQFVPWLPGIAHPTGYPLYVLLGWAWTHLLPLGQVAWRMNLLSALLAAGAVGLVFAVSRRILDVALPDTPHSARVITALISAATFAVTATFWSQAIIAEVYALHTLIVAGVIWLCLKFRAEEMMRRENKNAKNHLAASPHVVWWGRLLAFVFGLGLAHHLTTILLLPAVLVYLWLTRRPASGTLKRAVSMAVFAVVPLLLYLYLPVAATFTPYATLTLSNSQTLTLYNNSLQGFLEHITATVFTGELQPTAVGLERFALVWQLARQQVGWVGLLLATVGVVILWQQRQVALLALTGLGFAAIIVFNLVYFIGDVFVLFIPAWLFVCLWVGIGILGVAQGIARRFVQSKLDVTDEFSFGQIKARLEQNMYGLVVVGVTLFFFVLPVVLLVIRYSAIDQSANTAAAERWREILMEPIPESAILLSNDRNEIMPMWYYQYVEGQRPDLQGLFPLIVPEPAYANVGRVLDEALASGHPVYLIKAMTGLNLKADLALEGTLFSATKPDAAPEVSTEIMLPEVMVEDNQSETVKLVGYSVSTKRPTLEHEITITLFWQPVQVLSQNYTSYVHLTTTTGQGIAQNDHRPGGDFYPSSLWQPGELLRDTHTITIPANARPGEYHMRVGMYYQPEPGIIAGMGDGTIIGSVTVD